MVDQESVDAHYVRMIASLSELETESNLIRSSELTSSKVEDIENLDVNKDDLDISLHMDTQQIIPPAYIFKSCNKLKPNRLKYNPSIFSHSNSSDVSSKTIFNLLDDGKADSNLKKPILISNHKDLSNSVNIHVNCLPPSSTNNTAVEQPNIGPCSCFICGQILVDPSERYSYSNSQKLFYMQMSLLQLLSDVINQTVVTNTEYVDLCQQCSETMNEIDVAYKHLKDLKQDVLKLFNVNKRPKLTFHVLHNSQKEISNTKNISVSHDKSENNKFVNLDDLVLSRPKRGRGAKKLAKLHVNTHNISSVDISNKKIVKRKGGRPRKPFQCIICKRKFLTDGMIQSHIKKEHNYDDQPINFKTSIVNNTISKDEEAIILEAIKKVKTEDTEVNSENRIVRISAAMKSEAKPVMISKTHSELQHQVSLSAVTKSHYATFPVSSNLAKFNSPVRPIQPKPQTLVQTATDGSVLLYINPTDAEAPPTLIKLSRDYLNLRSDTNHCEICSKSFLDDKSFKMHRISVHGVRKRKQDISNLYCKERKFFKCSKEFNERIWKCCYCESIFQNKILLSEHKMNIHSELTKNLRKEKLYNCEQCDKSFFFKYEYETHCETHLPFSQVGPHEFLCCICGLKVASKASLKVHLHKFHDQLQSSKDYLCSECGYMSGSKKTFKDHMRNHSELPEAKTQCYLCEKEMLYSSFKTHMLRMHGEAKYPCETCSQKFTTRSDLMKHINSVHSLLKPYNCGICGKKFFTTEALRYHKNKNHSMENFLCGICGKNYKSKGDFKSHITRVHNESKTRFQCSVCTKSYGESRKLRNHISSCHKEKNLSQFGHSFSKSDDCYSQEALATSIRIELPSAIYESSNNSLTPQQNLISSNEITASQTMSQLLEPIDEPYQHPEQESITITTLQTHIPSHQAENNYIQIENQSQYHPTNEDQQHQSLCLANDQPSLDSHVSQNQDHSSLSQYSESLSNIQSIYLVSETVCL